MQKMILLKSVANNRPWTDLDSEKRLYNHGHSAGIGTSGGLKSGRTMEAPAARMPTTFCLLRFGRFDIAISYRAVLVPAVRFPAGGCTPE